MKHPDDSQWLDYLYGEASPAERFTLAAHLDQCAECASRVRRWESTRGTLDTWTLPAATPPTTAAPVTPGGLTPPIRPIATDTPTAPDLIVLPRSRWLPWAAAAAFALGAFTLGRLSAPPSPDVEMLRAEIRASVASQLDQLTRNQTTNTAPANAANTVSQEQFVQLVEALRSARVEDRETLLSRLQQIEQQRAADYASLRHDLETVAWQAESRLESTQARLGELARSTPVQP